MKLVLSCLLLVGTSLALPGLPWEDGVSRSGTTTCACGWTNRGRIVGGYETGKNEYPLAVMLQSPTGSQFCGGTIITHWHILTAAHCTYGKKAANIKANVGAHKKAARSDGVYDLAQIIEHEKFDMKKIIWDISLLVTKTLIRFNQNVGPACLPTGPLSLVGQKIKALGWGRLATEGLISNVLEEVDLTVITLAKCKQDWAGTRWTPQDHNLCTYELRKDTCQGDSGGPLIWLDPETNRYTLAALVSYGGECGGSQAAPNTDVSYFVPWINRKIAASKPGVSACTKA